MAEGKRALVLINKVAGTGKGANDTLDIATTLAQAGYEPIIYPIMPGTDLTSENLIEKYKDQLTFNE